MALSHLHLHTRDRAASARFYETWFGMRCERRGSALTFMTDERDFLLALMDDAAPATMPDWFHFGFRLDSADAVLALHDRMRDGGIVIRKPLYRDDDLVSYRCADPDGHAIEVFWERRQPAG